MTPPPWSYPPELIGALLDYGLRPTSATPPALVREAVNDLYRFELVRLRESRRAGDVAKADYIDRIVVLRKKYWPLTLQLPAWEQLCSGDVREARARPPA